MNTAKKAALVLAATGAIAGAATGTASATGGGADSGGGVNGGGASAKAVAVKSPGVISGNIIQVPIGIPINVVGNSLNVVGILNPAFGNVGANV
ncbi:chaplin [Streptomyces litchfieldiae]|uniref:Chaplin n=1 Tax=Streptomyces litchfieldiae TaxID=3075543 RepID=A0ABU2MTC8_9ACTN|nr:chaplin [Streptomyces sp. DSM 44938]MDT0344891.1 chaplin [Streptomyces sp. DSM 44938]